jgi:hypothetical protein
MDVLLIALLIALRDKYGTATAGLKGKVQAAAALDVLYKKSIWFEGIRDKDHQRTPRGTMARRRAFEFLYRVKACASAYWHPCLFSHEIPFARLTFCLQQQKVSKKCRSRAMLFIRLFCELSRSFALALGKRKPPSTNSISIHANCPTEFTK